MEVVAACDALERRDLGTVGLNGEEDARARRRAVDEDGARAADAVLAAEMRGRQVEPLP